MSRTPKTPAAAPASETVAASVSLLNLPAVAALIVLLDAMRALVSFPSRPVPDTLVEGVLNARRQFNEALSAPFEPVAVTGSDAYDDAWIRERFDKFASLIDERFEGLDEALKARFAAFDEAGSARAAELASLQSRIEALEARATAQAKD